MARKRVKQKQKKVVSKPKSEPIHETRKKTFLTKRTVTIITLVGIMFLVLFMNSYFNYTSGGAYNEDGDTLGTKFYLSGPDPYYNMRTCEETLEKGYYPYVVDEDPLLNYPVGDKGSRPPFFNMIAVSSALFVNTVSGMPVLDALGWCMLFLPAIYGALLIFPVYGIGKELFSRKVGVFSAFLIALIPIHIGSGHGSSFSLFDHDSFLLLLFTLTFYLFIKALKTKDKRGYFYAISAGVVMGAIQMTWVAAQVIFLIFCIFLVFYVFINILRTKYDMVPCEKVSIMLATAFIISLPYMMMINRTFHYPFLTMAFSFGVLLYYLVLKRINFPWLITIPTTFVMGGVGLSFLWLVQVGIIQVTGTIRGFANVIFGEGIYGSQVSLTIGEAATSELSATVMSFGPALYWLCLVGFIIFLYQTYKEKFKPEHILIICIFGANFWLTTVAARFLNELVPYMAILTAYFIMLMMDKVDLKKLKSNIEQLGFVKALRGMKATQVTIIGVTIFALVVPNTYLALDASVPPEMDEEVFGEGFIGAWGNNLIQQYYWADGLYWLSLQDTEIPLEKDRPALMAWWDYGFYTAAMSGHPAVADNYQSGIEPAANFHIAKSEGEAICVMIIRCTDGTIEGNSMPEDIKDVYRVYLPPYNETREIKDENGNVTSTYNVSFYPAQDIINYIENPKSSPSYKQLTAPEWGNTILTVSDENAKYHDVCRIMTENLTEEQIVNMYMDIKDATGYNIKYYGVEYRDMYEIFSVFPFLADRGTHGYSTGEDDYYITTYTDINTGNSFTLEEIEEMSETEMLSRNFEPKMSRKDGFYNTMIYKAYIGQPVSDGSIPRDRIPGYFLKHWALSYSSPYLAILTYYEGATINGTVTLGDENQSYDGTQVVVFDQYNIPKTYDITENGNFSVLAPAGNVSLQIYVGNNNLTGLIPITPVSEEEATRQVPRTEPPVEFHINTSSIDMNVYFNETYANLSCQNYTYDATLTIKSTTYMYHEFTEPLVAGNNTFHWDDIIPDNYQITISATNCTMHQEQAFFKPNNNTINIVYDTGGEDTG